MHVEYAITSNLNLMGTDAIPEMGQITQFGNNFSVSLHPETTAEADRIFAALSAEGKVLMALGHTFWGAYFGACTDRFGVQWMVNVQGATPQAQES